jgi:hypothetical protein
VCGRITGAVAPFAIYSLYAMNPAIPIAIITAFSVLNVVNLAFLPQDRTGKKLDADEEHPE